MGIKNLKKVLNNNGYEPISQTSSKFLQDKCNLVIGVDTSIFLYRYKNVFQENYLFGFLSQIRYFLNNNIIPVYVFDGKPTMEKEEELLSRKFRYDKMKNDIELLEMKVANAVFEEGFNEQTLRNQIEELKKRKANAVNITEEVVFNVKKLLKLMGIFYYEYDGEADLFLRYLSEKKLIDYVITEDMDLLTHGCDKVITNFNASNKKFEIYEIEEILCKLDINREQFIDMCIMLGCDYTGTPVGIGPVTALKYIKKYKTIENIIKNVKTVDYKKMDYKLARNMFVCEVKPKKKFSRKKFKIKYKKKNMEELNIFLLELNMSDKKIKELIQAFETYKKRLKMSLL